MPLLTPRNPSVLIHQADPKKKRRFFRAISESAAMFGTTHPKNKKRFLKMNAKYANGSDEFDQPSTNVDRLSMARRAAVAGVSSSPRWRLARRSMEHRARLDGASSATPPIDHRIAWTHGRPAPGPPFVAASPLGGSSRAGRASCPRRLIVARRARSLASMLGKVSPSEGRSKINSDNPFGVAVAAARPGLSPLRGWSRHPHLRSSLA